MKILVIEDEPDLSEVLAALLKQKKYAVDTAYDGLSGEDCIMSGVYDAVILDIMLPGKNGIDVLRSIRKHGNSTPVLLLTAKSEVEDKIAGLDTGADDYLTKPFSSGELLARIRAMTRRKGEFIGEMLSCNNTRLNIQTYELSHKTNIVKLSAKEFQIMELLMQNSRQIIPRERIVEKIWGFDTEAEYNTVEVYVSFIRKKLAAIDSDTQIKSTRGVGYSLEDIK